MGTCVGFNFHQNRRSLWDSISAVLVIASIFQLTSNLAWTAVELTIIHLATMVVIMIRGTITSTSLIFTRPTMLMAVPIITKRWVDVNALGLNVGSVGTDCRRVATPRVCDRLSGVKRLRTGVRSKWESDSGQYAGHASPGEQQKETE